MKKIVRKILAAAPIYSVSFSAKSAIIAATLSAAGKAFAGGTPSGIHAVQRRVMMSATQVDAIAKIVIDRLDKPDLDDNERAELEEIHDSITKQRAAIDENSDQ